MSTTLDEDKFKADHADHSDLEIETPGEGGKVKERRADKQSGLKTEAKDDEADKADKDDEDKNDKEDESVIPRISVRIFWSFGFFWSFPKPALYVGLISETERHSVMFSISVIFFSVK